MVCKLYFENKIVFAQTHVNKIDLKDLKLCFIIKYGKIHYKVISKNVVLTIKFNIIPLTSWHYNTRSSLRKEMMNIDSFGDGNYLYFLFYWKLMCNFPTALRSACFNFTLCADTENKILQVLPEYNVLWVQVLPVYPTRGPDCPGCNVYFRITFMIFVFSLFSLLYI